MAYQRCSCFISYKYSYFYLDVPLLMVEAAWLGGMVNETAARLCNEWLELLRRFAS